MKEHNDIIVGIRYNEVKRSHWRYRTDAIASAVQPGEDHKKCWCHPVQCLRESRNEFRIAMWSPKLAVRHGGVWPTLVVQEYSGM